MLSGLGQRSWSKTAGSSPSIGRVLQDKLAKLSHLSNGNVHFARLL